MARWTLSWCAPVWDQASWIWPLFARADRFETHAVAGLSTWIRRAPGRRRSTASCRPRPRSGPSPGDEISASSEVFELEVTDDASVGSDPHERPTRQASPPSSTSRQGRLPRWRSHPERALDRVRRRGDALQMRQNLRDGLRLFDAGDDLELAASARAGLDLDAKDPLQPPRPALGLPASTPPAADCGAPNGPATGVDVEDWIERRRHTERMHWRSHRATVVKGYCQSAGAPGSPCAHPSRISVRRPRAGPGSRCRLEKVIARRPVLCWSVASSARPTRSRYPNACAKATKSHFR